MSVERATSTPLRSGGEIRTPALGYTAHMTTPEGDQSTALQTDSGSHGSSRQGAVENIVPDEERDTEMHGAEGQPGE